jgi:F0F1-type ATP synthase membrane subunit a
MKSDHIFENENLKKLEFKYSTAGSMTDVVGIVYFLSLGAGAFRLLFDIGWAVSHLKSIEFLAWPFISLIVGSIQIYIFMYFQIVNSSDQLNKNR